MPGLIHTTGDLSFATPDPDQAFFSSGPGTWRGVEEVFWGGEGEVAPARREGGGHGGAIRHVIDTPRGVSYDRNQDILAITALLAMYYAYDE